MEVEHLLSDEYVEFSKNIAELHAKKKLLKDEFKTKLEELQKLLKDACKTIDEEAKVLMHKWEEWLASHCISEKSAKPDKKG